MTGGDCSGYEEASVRKMRAICAHGAAQGVWKDITISVDEGREETCLSKAWASVMSIMADIVPRSGKETREHGDTEL